MTARNDSDDQPHWGENRGIKGDLDLRERSRQPSHKHGLVTMVKKRKCPLSQEAMCKGGIISVLSELNPHPLYPPIHFRFLDVHIRALRAFYIRVINCQSPQQVGTEVLLLPSSLTYMRTYL